MRQNNFIFTRHKTKMTHQTKQIQCYRPTCSLLGSCLNFISQCALAELEGRRERLLEDSKVMLVCAFFPRTGVFLGSTALSLSSGLVWRTGVRLPGFKSQIHYYCAVWHVGSQFSKQGPNRCPCIGSTESQPLDHQRSPLAPLFESCVTQESY